MKENIVTASFYDPILRGSAEFGGDNLCQIPALEQVDAAGLLYETLTSDDISNLELISRSNTKGESTILKISPPLTKQERTLIHQAIKLSYPVLESRTSPEINSEYTSILVYTKQSTKISRNYSVGTASSNSSIPMGTRSKLKSEKITKRWDKNVLDYTHFTMTKKLLTTTGALQIIAKELKVPITRFSYSGTKDSFALTSQRISGWRISASAIADLREKGNLNPKNRTRPDILLKISDISSSAKPMALGDLRGNFFQLILRARSKSWGLQSNLTMKHPNFTEQNYQDMIHEGSATEPLRNALDRLCRYVQHKQIAEKDIFQTLTSLCQNGDIGFPNLFGPQRFGQPFNINVVVGHRLLVGDYRGAVLALLLSLSRLLPYHSPLSEPGGSTSATDTDTDPPDTDKDLDHVTEKVYIHTLYRLLEQLYPTENTNLANTTTAHLPTYVTPHLRLENPLTLSLLKHWFQELRLIPPEPQVTEEGPGQPVLGGSSIPSDDTRPETRSFPEKYLLYLEDALSLTGFSVKDIVNNDADKEDSEQSAGSKVVPSTSNENKAAVLSRALYVPSPQYEILESLRLHPRDWARAFFTLPLSMRSIFVNSVQSLLWNMAVNLLLLRRLQLHDHRHDRESNATHSALTDSITVSEPLAGALWKISASMVQEGDIVLVDSTGKGISAGDACERNLSLNADLILTYPANQSSTGGYRVSNDERENISSSALFESSKAFVHVVTAEEAEQAVYNNMCLVLPVPGHATISPRWLLEELYSISCATSKSDVVSDEIIGLGLAVLPVLVNGSHSLQWMNLPGAYRHVFTNARNVRWIGAESYRTFSNADVQVERQLEELLKQGDVRFQDVNQASTIQPQCADNHQVPVNASSKPNASDGLSALPLQELVEELWDRGELSALIRNATHSSASFFPPTKVGGYTATITEQGSRSVAVAEKESLTSDSIQVDGFETETSGGYGVIGSDEGYEFGTRGETVINQMSKGTRRATEIEESTTTNTSSFTLSFSLGSSSYATTFVNYLLICAESLSPLPSP